MPISNSRVAIHYFEYSEHFISILVTVYKDHLCDSLNAGSKMVKAARKAG